MEIVSVIGRVLFKHFSRTDGELLEKPIFGGFVLFYAVVFDELWYNRRDNLDAALPAKPFCPKLAWQGKTDSVGNVVTGGGAAVAARYDWRKRNDYVI